MRNLETINYTNKITKSRKEIMDIIKKDWANLQWCNIEDFDSGIKFIVDSQNPKLTNTKKIKEEIQVLSLRNWWTVINVFDECFDELSEIIQKFWINQEKIGELLQRQYTWVLTPYCSVQSYLFTDEKLTPIDPNVRKLERSEKAIFEAFREKCSEEDKYEVYMDFDVTFHEFYAYFYNNEIVALWDYCKIHDEDKVALPSIITREDCRWKWYGKAVVNAISHKIIEEWLVPRYRADPKNIASRNIAKSLWYEEIFDWFSLAMR